MSDLEKIALTDLFISPYCEENQLNQKASPRYDSDTETLFNETKEFLWPVFLTYCSCGDSINPGKISGPNLFTLLSKLGVLNEKTNLSEVGILLHQISAHSLNVAPLSRIAGDEHHSTGYQSPSLSFDEYLVFLCAFSELYYEGKVELPIFVKDKIESPNESDGNAWFKSWLPRMKTSSTFLKFIKSCILPQLQGKYFLAFPEDARYRDRYDLLFSIEFLLIIEKYEKTIFDRFNGNYKKNYGNFISLIENLSSSYNDLFHSVKLEFVSDLIIDILPKQESYQAKKSPTSISKDKSKLFSEILSPHFEWILTIIAFQVAANRDRNQNSYNEMFDTNILSIKHALTCILDSL